MQVVTSRASAAPQTSRLLTSESQNAVSGLPPALKLMLERIAGSSRLSLAQKRSFADALKNAYESNDAKQIYKIMTLVAQTEAQNAQGRYNRSSVAEILSNQQADGTSVPLDVSSLLTGKQRMQQLLFS